MTAAALLRAHSRQGVGLALGFRPGRGRLTVCARRPEPLERDAPEGRRVDPWSAAIIEQNRRWLTAYLLSMTGDPSAADDLVQETFIIAYRKRDVFKAGTNFGGWLRSIARNVALQHLKKRGRRPVVDHQETLDRLDRVAAESESRSVDPGFVEKRSTFLRECLEKLSERMRGILAMRYSQGMSSIDIAEAMNCRVPAVNTAIFRARMALGECIRGKEGR